MTTPPTPKRQSIRLPGWDYRTASAYFVTICTHNREHLFANEVFADIAMAQWQAIPQHSSHAVLDSWVLMPNHLHGILILAADITKSDSQADPVFDVRWMVHQPGDNERLFANAPSGSLGAIIGNYKGVVARKVNRARSTPGKHVWQRGYYERVVRDSGELERIRANILNNPERWAAKQDDLNALLTRMSQRL